MSRSPSSEKKPDTTGHSRRGLVTVVIAALVVAAFAGGAIAAVVATRPPAENISTTPTPLPPSPVFVSPTISPKVESAARAEEKEDPGSEEVKGGSSPEGVVRRFLIARNSDSMAGAAQVADDTAAGQIFSYPKVNLEAVSIACSAQGASATCTVRGAGAPTPMVVTTVEAAKNTWRITQVEPDV